MKSFFTAVHAVAALPFLISALMIFAVSAVLTGIGLVLLEIGKWLLEP